MSSRNVENGVLDVGGVRLSLKIAKLQKIVSDKRHVRYVRLKHRVRARGSKRTDRTNPKIDTFKGTKRTDRTYPKIYTFKGTKRTDRATYTYLATQMNIY